jgi:FixJ family two-component response regulator
MFDSRIVRPKPANPPRLSFSVKIASDGVNIIENQMQKINWSSRVSAQRTIDRLQALKKVFATVLTKCYTHKVIIRNHMETPETINLLFIDDDSGYMSVAQQLLAKYQGKKFNIHWKQDGHSALEELKANKAIDLLLIDYYLPEMNGLEVTKVIRESKIEVPIIFLTSNRDFRLAIEAMKYGIEDFMVKDEAVDSVLPRTIVNILERVYLKQKIAEQQRADLIAKKRTDAIKELVVTVCHEFNNPLAAMKISTDILARQQLQPQESDLIRELDQNISLIEKEITKLRDINFERIEFSHK